MAKLVIFDVDGTLVESKAVFSQTIREEFGISNIGNRWQDYQEITDSGIFEEIFQKAFCRKPSTSEIQRCITKMLKLTESYNTSCREIKGAKDVVKTLKTHKQWRIGIATGGWKELALMKLRFTGIDIKGIPIVSSSEIKSRENIVRKCITEAMNYYRVNEFKKIVSVGDGIWDLKIASKLQIAFIGINMIEKYKATSNCIALEDYTDQCKFMKFLEEAEIPNIKSAV